MTTATETLPRPSDLLGSKPSIRSEADADAALHELAFLNALAAGIDAQRSNEEEALRQRYAALHVTDVDGEAVTINARRDALNAELEKYAAKNRAALCPGKQKSRKLPHGTIGWKSAPERLDFAEGQTATTVRDYLEKALEVVTKATAAVRRLTLTGTGAARVTAADLCNVNVAPSTSKATALYREKRLNRKDAKRFGFRVVDAAENFYAAPGQLPVDPA